MELKRCEKHPKTKAQTPSLPEYLQRLQRAGLRIENFVVKDGLAVVLLQPKVSGPGAMRNDHEKTEKDLSSRGSRLLRGQKNAEGLIRRLVGGDWDDASLPRWPEDRARKYSVLISHLVEFGRRSGPKTLCAGSETVAASWLVALQGVGDLWTTKARFRTRSTLAHLHS